MKKLILSIFTILALGTQGNAQAFSNEIGGSGILSVMNTNYGYVPGMGAEIKHRLNFLNTNFSLKNSFGMTSFAMTAYDVGNMEGGRIKGQDYLWMFDVIGEFNLINHRLFDRKPSNSINPYIGVGPNIIYRFTNEFRNIEASTGTFITLKANIGLKYKLQPNVLLNLETSFDWDFSDNLDGLQYTTDHWYNYDHIGSVRLGLTYFLDSSPRNRGKNIWSNL